MATQELFTVSLESNPLECWDDESTASALRALARCDLRGHLDYVKRNLIEKWFQTLAMRIDRFHQTWMGGSAQRWLAAFAYYYNFQRSHQALDNRTPVEEVQNR